MPVAEGWLWNQVLMDLGAMVCRPNPTCDECPVADTHGQYRFSFRHPHIRSGQEIDYIIDAFRRDLSLGEFRLRDMGCENVA